MTKEQKQKEFEDQLEDEEVLFVFRKHPIVMRRGFIYAMIALLLGTVPSLIKPEYIYLFGGLAAGFLAGVIVFIPHWITWHFSIFIVTNQRFIQIKQKGFFHKKSSDLNLKHIQSMNHEIKGVEETLLGFGKITIQTYMGDVVLNQIHRPGDVQLKIQEILREYGIEPNEFGKKDQEKDEE